MTQRTVVLLSFILFVAGLFWGGYTLLVYLGIPIHQLVYGTQDDVRVMELACGAGSTIGTYLCRGSALFFPFVIALFRMGSPFFAYTVVCALLYAGLLLLNGYRTGYFEIKTVVRPILLPVLFLLSLWLIATTLSLGTFYNANTPADQLLADTSGKRVLPPFNRFYEPLPQVYGNSVGPEGMAELKANYDALLSRGCLTEIGTTQNGARIYDLHFLCIQESFFARVGLQVVMIGILLLNLLVLGGFLLRKALRMESMHPLLTLSFSVALGALGWIAILWTLAVFGALSTIPIRILFFGMPLLLFFETRRWIAVAMRPSIEFEASWKSVFPVLVWLLITYLALNFFNVVRPFPIGWDDLGSYLNRPRLLASYGAFIPSMAQFQWEYLTSLGFLFFGYDSWHGSTFAMEINWMAGLFAVLSVYAFGRVYLGKRRGVLAAILYYFLPMTGHFSFADMKIDNAVFFASTVATLAAFVALFPPDTTEKNPMPSSRMMLLAGVLAAFAFAIKPTAVLSILLILSAFGGSLFGAVGFAGMAVTGFGILQYFGALSLKEIASRALFGLPVSQSTLAQMTLVAGFAIFAYAVSKQKDRIRPAVTALGYFIAGIAIACAPWMSHNVFIAKHLAVSALLSAPDLVAPQVFYQQKEEVATYNLAPTIPVRTLPPELKLDPAHPACTGSARTEELDRYWGFGRGFMHYLTLPWRQVMNIDAFGYYVTLMPALLLFPLALLLPFFWDPERKWLRVLFAGTFIFLIQWALVANGIAWYGIGMFLGLSLVLEAFIAYAPDTQNRSLFAFFLTMGILVCLINRLWQFDTQKNIFEYPLGKVSASALREITIPNYDDIRESVVTRHDTLKEMPYTYRIGTFISYFIPRNREILPLADHQMTFFNCLNQERDHPLTLKRLKSLGFNSIIFDTNTQTIERDPNGSLHQKVNAFLNFANDASLGLNITVNDPGNGIAYILLPTQTGATTTK